MEFLSHPSLSLCFPILVFFSGVPIPSRKGTQLPSTLRLSAANTSIGSLGHADIPLLAVAFAEALQS